MSYKKRISVSAVFLLFTITAIDAQTFADAIEALEDNFDPESHQFAFETFYALATEEGHAAAAGELAGMLSGNARYPPVIDRQYALEWHKIAAERGHAYSAYTVGTHYLEREVPELETAYSWFRQAAEDGHAQASVRVSWFFKEGYVVERDQAERLRWLRHADENGANNVQGTIDLLERQIDQREQYPLPE